MANVTTVAETLEDKLTHDLGYDDHFHEHHQHRDDAQIVLLPIYSARTTKLLVVNSL